MPKILESVAGRIHARGRRKGSKSYSKASSYAIATAALQKAGHLKKGTTTLTKKGRRWRPRGRRSKRR